MNKHGVLLINLGTPEQCAPQSVYCYLTEFLNDPRVIDLPGFLRWVLVNLVIIPLRFKKSAAAYQKIWSDCGSPLLVNSRKLQQALAVELGNAYQVELGMRYGKPSIQSALAKLAHCHRLTLLPLFPQYSAAATGSAIASALNILSAQWNIPEIFIKRDFYDHPHFIAAYADVIKKNIAGKNIERIVFSYHGLPERHIQKSNCQASCDHAAACPPMNDSNLFCYRAQCHATTHLLAKALNLNAQHYRVAFQSRLGRTPWIKPYTDLLLPELMQQGVKNIAVVCPSFVADCLETLEEINIRAREQWLKLGGKEFIFIPCLNDHPAWVTGLAEISREK
jgi:ferrochelatase